MLFLPKGNADTQGIGLLEVLSKAVKVVIDTQVKTDVQFHDIFHSFRGRQGIGMATMRLKMVKYMSSIY